MIWLDTGLIIYETRHAKYISVLPIRFDSIQSTNLQDLRVLK